MNENKDKKDSVIGVGSPVSNYQQCCNKLLGFHKTFGEKIPKPELKDIPKEIIKKWFEDGTIADYGDYYIVGRLGDIGGDDVKS